MLTVESKPLKIAACPAGGDHPCGASVDLPLGSVLMQEFFLSASEAAHIITKVTSVSFSYSPFHNESSDCE